MVDIRLDHDGLAEVLKDMCRHIVDDAAGQVADAFGGDGVLTDSYTTDRAAASVSVPAARQAKDGELTRAAASVGLEVREKR